MTVVCGPKPVLLSQVAADPASGLAAVTLDGLQSFGGLQATIASYEWTIWAAVGASTVNITATGAYAQVAMAIGLYNVSLKVLRRGARRESKASWQGAQPRGNCGHRHASQPGELTCTPSPAGAAQEHALLQQQQQQ